MKVLYYYDKPSNTLKVSSNLNYFKYIIFISYNVTRITTSKNNEDICVSFSLKYQPTKYFYI